MKKDHVECPICGSENIVYRRHTGEHICRSCGYIILDKEQRYYKPYDKDISSKKLKSKNTHYITLQRRNYRENVLEEVKDYIEKYGESLSLPPVDISTAKALLHKVINKGRWNRRYLALALLYISNKYNSFDKRSIKDFITLDGGFDAKKLRKTVKNILKISNITLKYRLDEREIFSLFYETFGYDDKVDEFMEKLYEGIRRYNIIRRKSPKTVYIAVAYIAYRMLKESNGRNTVTLRRVTEVTDVSEAPIRNAVKEILRGLRIEIHV